MKLDRMKPYNQLPNLPPKTEIETQPVLKQCIKASRALAELKQAGGLIPNQSVLINTIPLIEARLSSEIENIVTTSDRLFRLASGANIESDPATKETLRYQSALSEGSLSLKKRPIGTGSAVQICRTIRDVDINIRTIPGTVVVNPASGRTIYTPPEGETLIREKMANWEHFINNKTGIDPLVRMAVMHYQFEAIHPFTDGNGRTGRILCILYLIQEGLLDIPVLYLSRYIIKHKNQYYQSIQQVTEDNAWEQWILFMLHGVEETASWTLHKIRAVRELVDHTCTYVREMLPKIYSRELVELTFVQPYCRINNVVNAGIVKRQSASVYLKALADIGVLEEIRAGREKLFVHPKFVQLLTGDSNDFAQYE
ncbi:MAG: protein adenylyltransferase Fic [Spirochaetota bacterium]